MNQQFFIKHLKLELEAVQPIYVQEITKKCKYIFMNCIIIRRMKHLILNLVFIHLNN
jgi:hypothetical protein